MHRKIALAMTALILPPVALGLAFDRLFQHRSDCLGHFLAGYGGTLGVVALTLALVPAEKFARRAGWATLVAVLACIGLGAIFEETLYRIAKWDEVDFCNQSLGAVLAGLGALAATPLFTRPERQAPRAPFETNGHAAAAGDDFMRRVVWLAVVGAWALLTLMGGYYFAFR